MAIQVSGTTVIDDSRNLVNVIGIKTVNSTSLLGAGDIAAGASTTYGAVGTYTWGRPNNITDYEPNDTASGLVAVRGVNTEKPYYNNPTSNWSHGIAVALSGTWRTMSGAGWQDPSRGLAGLWVRIS
jgi:hypothetical protein